MDFWLGYVASWGRRLGGLRSVCFDEGPRVIGRRCFQGCSLLAEIALPDSIREIQFGAFADCSSLYKISLGRGLAVMSEGYVF